MSVCICVIKLNINEIVYLSTIISYININYDIILNS